MREFQGGDINAVLRLVRSLTDDGDCQLSILTMAMVVACRSCEVEKADALQIISDCFDDERELVPLDSALATGA